MSYVLSQLFASQSTSAMMMVVTCVSLQEIRTDGMLQLWLRS